MPGDLTKEKILDVSLTLFSQRGFSAVSIRDICKEVKIKESSVYYHFASKRAILEELQRRFEAAAEERMGRLEEAVAGVQSPAPPPGEKISEAFFEHYLMDDFCNRYMRLLHIEQNNSEEMRTVYDTWMFQRPLQFQDKIFAALIAQKAFKSTDSSYLAVKYYAPIFLFFQRYLLSGELTERKKEKFRQKAYGHIANFFSENGGI